jgi:hypothetical protein
MNHHSWRLFCDVTGLLTKKGKPKTAKLLPVIFKKKTFKAKKQGSALIQMDSDIPITLYLGVEDRGCATF